MKIILAIVAALLAGCATTGDVYIGRGAMPDYQGSEDTILPALKAMLKDPDSIKQFSMSGPTPVQWYRGLLNGGGFDEGWLWCVQYNAKNSFGGYVGIQTLPVVVRKNYISGRVEIVTAFASCV